MQTTSHRVERHQLTAIILSFLISLIGTLGLSQVITATCTIPLVLLLCYHLSKLSRKNSRLLDSLIYCLCSYFAGTITGYLILAALLYLH